MFFRCLMLMFSETVQMILQLAFSICSSKMFSRISEQDQRDTEGVKVH